MSRIRTARRLAMLVALIGLLICVWYRKPVTTDESFSFVGSIDLMEYWGAARLLVRGENPYDPDALFALQQQLGWSRSEPVTMWNPPWTLAVVLPFAFMPFRWAVRGWFVCELGLLLGCGLLLWQLFAAEDRRYWLGLLLAAGFPPALFALSFGQISPWILAGVVGFLWAERNQRDVLAGAALSLLLIKPHAGYLFWLAALWWAWRAHRWGIIAGSLAVLTVSAALVTALSPGAFPDYCVAISDPPMKWATPTLGFWLRLAFGLDRAFLQYAPSIIGILMLVGWLARLRRAWDWRHVAPPLLLASSATAAYGWSYDHVLLLPAVVVLVARQSGSHTGHRLTTLGALLGVEVALLVPQILGVGDYVSVWHAPALAGLYWWDGRRPKRGSQKQSGQDVEAAGSGNASTRAQIRIQTTGSDTAPALGTGAVLNAERGGDCPAGESRSLTLTFLLS